ncbi:hypothetical protein EIN_398080 [Entamoeba invadens IP1]|uniref:Uncharacterized protein n=1 Tax=Entamoeba invadens IP1 TaxID=370355 RepID=A0A0A1U9Z3_ENTIV|nr:hypothetical protein EIN_398080 [Entamoeba invadens IP1]ELP91878.1 hypothetical protein EIN_398080 [Entamoeba invadens IP1]|eukprot:XP_004258649.1 hypothetical protein EIN_398080 [Entamoeba invadens IP1]
MQTEEVQFTMCDNAMNYYPPDGLKTPLDAFLYFTLTSFYTSVGGDLKIAPEELSLEKIMPFKVFEHKRPNQQSIFLIVKYDPDFKIRNAFFIINENVFPATSLSTLICCHVDEIMSDVVDLFDRLNDTVKIDPLKGHAWCGVPLMLEDYTTPLPEQESFINEKNVYDAIDSFLKVNPLN